MSALDRAIRERLDDSVENALNPQATADACLAVLNLHWPLAPFRLQPEEVRCVACSKPDLLSVAWPCPTVRAIAAALHVEVPGGAG